jgi:hypothetical protein
MPAVLQPPRVRIRLPQVLNLGEATAIAGQLGSPSKLPGYSYGLDAHECRTGSILAAIPGSVCEGCYARGGWYSRRQVIKDRQRERREALAHPRWVDAMAVLIGHRCRPPHDFFRWHDAGDIISPDHLGLIAEVARRTPSVKHWLPTHEYHDVAAYLARGGVIPPNLVVRLSADMVDAEAVVPLELAHLPTSTVQSWPSGTGAKLVDRKGAIECRAIERRDNTCGECRACWDARVANVSYPKH